MAGLMMSMKQRSSSYARSTSIPLPMAVCLCLACFLTGYVSHRPLAAPLASMAATAPRKLQAQDSSNGNPQAQLIQPQVLPPAVVKLPSEQAVEAAGQHPQHSQEQRQQQQQQQQVVQAPAVPLAPEGELPDHGTFTQAFLEQSGLLKLRPPLQPAKSGNDFYTVVPYQILSWHPRILVFPNFIDKQRAQHIIDLARKRIRPSDLAWRRDETPDAEQQIRTSSGVFLSRAEDPDGVLAWVEEKIASVTMLPPSHGEAFNVLRYELNQKYDSHMDTFDPKDFGPQYSQRLATMLLYLSEVEEGGETVFKREGQDGADRPVNDWASCEPEAFKYKPRLGDAVLFYSLDPDLKINPRSLHGGCAVRKGEKWVATKWIHEKPLARP